MSTRAPIAGQRQRIEQRRQKTHARGYDQDWQVVRTLYLAEHPICEAQNICQRLPPGARLATEVHHRQDIAQRPDLRLDMQNLQALCHACHSAITMKAMGL